MKTWLWRKAINHAKDYLKSWYAKNVEVTEDGLFTTVISGDCVIKGHWKVEVSKWKI